MATASAFGNRFILVPRSVASSRGVVAPKGLDRLMERVPDSTPPASAPPADPIPGGSTSTGSGGPQGGVGGWAPGFGQTMSAISDAPSLTGMGLNALGIPNPLGLTGMAINAGTKLAFPPLGLALAFLNGGAKLFGGLSSMQSLSEGMDAAAPFGNGTLTDTADFGVGNSAAGSLANLAAEAEQGSAVSASTTPGGTPASFGNPGQNILGMGPMPVNEFGQQTVFGFGPNGEPNRGNETNFAQTAPPPADPPADPPSDPPFGLGIGLPPGPGPGEGDAGDGGDCFLATYAVKGLGADSPKTRAFLKNFYREFMRAHPETGKRQLAVYQSLARKIITKLDVRPALRADVQQRILDDLVTPYGPTVTPDEVPELRDVLVSIITDVAPQVGVPLPTTTLLDDGTRDRVNAARPPSGLARLFQGAPNV